MNLVDAQQLATRDCRRAERKLDGCDPQLAAEIHELLTSDTLVAGIRYEGLPQPTLDQAVDELLDNFCPATLFDEFYHMDFVERIDQATPRHDRNDFIEWSERCFVRELAEGWLQEARSARERHRRVFTEFCAKRRADRRQERAAREAEGAAAAERLRRRNSSFLKQVKQHGQSATARARGYW